MDRRSIPRRPSRRPSASPGALWRRLRHDRRSRPVLALALITVALMGVQAERQRADAVRGAWSPTTTVWVSDRELDAGHLLSEGDVELRALPPAAIPVDAAIEPPWGRRLVVSIGRGEILREARLDATGSSAAGSRVGPRRGAVSLTAPAPHLEPGDRVDLYRLLDGRVVASGAEVIAVVDERPLVAVGRAELGAVVEAFTTGDVVPVLVS
jgi:Flp pilus assembly protein CpaB